MSRVGCHAPGVFDEARRLALDHWTLLLPFSAFCPCDCPRGVVREDFALEGKVTGLAGPEGIR